MFSANNIPHEWLLTIKQTTKLRNAIENNMSTDIKLSKAQISKIIQSGGFLGSLLSKIAGPLMKVAVPIAKNILAPLNILLKGVTKTIKNETKEQKRGLLSMLLGTLGTSLLGNLLSGKETVRAGEAIARAGYGSSIKKKL